MHPGNELIKGKKPAAIAIRSHKIGVAPSGAIGWPRLSVLRATAPIVAAREPQKHR
jgi:hypothetical protein